MGPMYSGKTTQLYKLMNYYSKKDKKVLLVLPLVDGLYTNPKDSRNGDKWSGDFINIKDLNLIKEKSKNYDVIALDEVQFFSCNEDQVKSIVEFFKREKKGLIASGLDLTSELIVFSTTIYFEKYIDTTIKLKSRCNICDVEDVAEYTYHIGQPKKSTIEIDNGSNYIPICRNCYDNKIESN